MVEDSSEYEEPVVCTECESRPELFYDPTASDSYRLRCECDLTSANVTDDLNSCHLTEMTGKWSNLNYDSEMDNVV